MVDGVVEPTCSVNGAEAKYAICCVAVVDARSFASPEYAAYTVYVAPEGKAYVAVTLRDEGSVCVLITDPFT